MRQGLQVLTQAIEYILEIHRELKTVSHSKDLFEGTREVLIERVLLIPMNISPFLLSSPWPSDAHLTLFTTTHVLLCQEIHP